TGGAVGAFNIGIYASSDRVTPEQLLQSAAATDLQSGTHTLTISPTFGDLHGNYSLVAIVDANDDINETHEDNNEGVDSSPTPEEDDFEPVNSSDVVIARGDEYST